jgi:hypothetical protein
MHGPGLKPTVSRRTRLAAGAAAVLGAFGTSVGLSAQTVGAAPTPQTTTDQAVTQQANVQQNSAEPSSVQPSSAQPSSAQATTPAPEPSVPAAVGLSGQLANWLQIRAEYRGRLEGFSGGGYKPDSSDAYMLDRFRVNATVAPAKTVKFVVQMQDARAFDKTTGGQAAPFRDTLDLRLAYGEFGDSQNRIRAGRQELVFGEQRLIGHLNWVNAARSFDGVDATITRKAFKFDLFAASVVNIQPGTIGNSGNGNALYGFYGSAPSLVPKAVVEPYLLWRQSTNVAVETGGAGELHQATIGARIVGKLPSDFDYGTEMALQRGSVATDDVHAWAGHWVAGRTFTRAPGTPRLFAEDNYGSGDRNPKDGTRGTFDQLYPTGHDKLGLADQVGWRNIENLRGGVELKPRAQWSVAGSYHSFWLASTTDALYSASGAAVARSVTGSAGRYVGQEVDVQAVYTYSPQLQFNGGYAYLIPGEFLKNTTPGQSYSYSYLMVTYVFLGDKPGAPGGRQPR